MTCHRHKLYFSCEQVEARSVLCLIIVEGGDTKLDVCVVWMHGVWFLLSYVKNGLPYCQWMRCCLSLDGRTVDMFYSFSPAIYISRVQSKYCTGEKGDKKVHLMESKHRRRNWNLSGKSSTMTHSLEVYQPCFITMRHSFGACLVET